jgi:hypothetical protein
VLKAPNLSRTRQGRKSALFDLPLIFCHDRELKAIHLGRHRLDLSRAEVRNVVERAVPILPQTCITATRNGGEGW